VTGEIGPEYKRLMDQIRSKIISGEYPVGAMIPSTAELKETTGLSVTVVRRAVGQLEIDGILEGHPGKGVYVKALPADVDGEHSAEYIAVMQQVAEVSQEVEQLREEFRQLREMVRDHDVMLEEMRSHVPGPWWRT